MPTSPPLVSILMLTYNRAHFIGEAITSVLAQSYQNWELLILDDGSTDDTAQVVSSYPDTRIRYLRDEVNRGLLYRRREAVKLARGQYLAVLDSDDYWLDKEKLEKQLTIMNNQNSCVVVGTFIKLVNEKGEEIGKNQYQTDDQKIRQNILIRNQFANSSVLISKSAFDKTDGYRDFAPTEDLDLFLQLGRVGTFANLPLYATAYRLHQGGVSSSKIKLLGRVLTVIKGHKDAYPHYFIAWLKFTLYWLVVRLGLK